MNHFEPLGTSLVLRGFIYGYNMPGKAPGRINRENGRETFKTYRLERDYEETEN